MFWAVKLLIDWSFVPEVALARVYLAAQLGVFGLLQVWHRVEARRAQS